MKKLLNQKQIEPIIFALISLSILFPFYISSLVTALGAGVLFFTHYKELKEAFLKTHWLGIFIFYSLLVGLFYQNWIGVGVGVVMFLFAMLFYFYQRYLTFELYQFNLKVFVFGSIPLALLSYYKYSRDVLKNGYDLLYIFKYHNPQTRAEATFFNPNYYGLYIAMVLIMAIYLFSQNQNRRFRWVMVLTILMNLMSLILTGSRWSIPTVIVGAVIMLFFLKPKLAWGLGFLLVGGFIALLIRPDLLPRFTTLAHGFEDRFAIWQVGWNLFLTSPIVGRGPMTYVNFYYLFADKGKMHAHQLLVDCLANYGLVGMMLLVMAFSRYFRQLFRGIFNPQIRPEMGLVVATVLTVLFHGLMDVGIFWIQTGYIFLALVTVTPTQLQHFKTKEADSL